MKELDDFVKHYLIAALWSSTDNNEEPLDGAYDIDDLAPETLAAAIADCERFQTVSAELLADAYIMYDALGLSYHPDAGSAQACAGHDFWLTRCGHGIGFWDRGFNDLGDQLTALVGYCTEFPPVELYVGEDGKIYHM